jgi:hypothetical protein
MPHRSSDSIRSLLRRLENPGPYRPKQAPRNKPPAAHRSRSYWTPEEVETCLRLRAEGLALKAIAEVVRTHSQASIGTKLVDLRTGRRRPSLEAPDAPDSVALDIAQRRAWISPQAAVLIRPYLISMGFRP